MNLRDSLIFFEDNFLSISNTGELSPCAIWMNTPDMKAY